MIRRSLVSCILSLAVSLGAIACSSNAAAPQGGKGGQGTSGVASSGGKTGSGGTNSGGTGGTAQTGEGGSSASGGSSSETTGGVTSVGGSTGKGGATGAAGGGAGAAAGGASGGAVSSGTGGTGPASGGRSGGAGGSGGDGGVSGSGGRDSGATGGQAGGTGGTNADASSSTGGTGGGTGYNPCKASPCIILPLGDSITHGFGSSDDAGYRSALFKLIVAANQNVTFVGSLSNGPSTVSAKPFPAHHEGHDGISVSGITGWVPPAKAFTATPQIVLLHIGTNDMTSNADPTTTANQLDTLVSNLVKAAPDALVLVAKIIPLFYASTTYNNYAAKIPGIVSKHAASGEHVVMVDMTSFPSSDFGNGVHPSDQGYAYMANLWYAAIKGVLPN